MILILYIKQYLVDIGIAHSRTPRSPRRLRISPNRGKDWWRFFSVPPNYPISSLATPIGLLVLFDLQSSLLLRQIRVAVLVLGGLMGRKIRSIWMTDGLQPDFQTWKWNKPRNQLVNRSVPMFRTSGRSQAACSTSYRGDLTHEKSGNNGGLTLRFLLPSLNTLRYIEIKRKVGMIVKV